MISSISKVRTLKDTDKPRRLEEICIDSEPDDFSIVLLGNTYCRLKPSYDIDCAFREVTKDNNGMYPCLKYEMSEYYE